MRAQIKELRYWKTEHKEEGCQDAHALNPAKGLFVVADGAGTTLFPAIWARILADHFVNIPLIIDPPQRSGHPFEIEWWVRLAQEEYKVRIPNQASLLDWSIRQKAQNQSSDSTLATLRISDVGPATARAELLVFGDSCVIIGNATTRGVESFVLERPEEFALAPICLPSSLKFFSRHFHVCSVKRTILGPEHTVILASDAVSKWILSGGGGRFKDEDRVWAAFQMVCNALSAEDWPAFIEACREAKEMVNDDSTALILALREDSSEEGVPLGTTIQHEPAVVQEREAAFNKARREHMSDLMAIYYGDGQDFQMYLPPLAEQEIVRAREVADALNEVLRAFRQVQNKPGLVASMQTVWQKNAPTLKGEPCAANIRETLRNNGVNVEYARPEPHPQSAQPVQAPDTRPIAQPNPPIAVGEEDSPEQAALEHAFHTAIGRYNEAEKTHFEALLKAADNLEAARKRYTHIYSPTEVQQEKIQQARMYQQAREKLRAALQSGLLEQIEDAYQPDTIDVARLTPSEQQRIELARRLLGAYKDRNNAEADAIKAEIRQAGLLRFFNFAPQEQEQKEQQERLQRQQFALNAFRVAMQFGNARQIVESYNQLPEEAKSISEGEQKLVLLALMFIHAYDSDNDNAILTAYEKVCGSIYYDKIDFTHREMQRIQKARAHRDKMQTVVATVKDHKITLEEVKNASIVERTIRSYFIEKYRRELNDALDEATRSEKRSQIMDLQEDIEPKNIGRFVLDIIINDLFIQEAIQDFDLQNAFSQAYQAESRLSGYLQEIFHYSQPAEYDAFLHKYNLEHESVRNGILMNLRYRFLKENFKNQQKSLLYKMFRNFDSWLDGQRKGVKYTQKMDDEQRAQELAAQLGL